MTDDYQQCGSQHVVSGVKVTCHRIVRHDGPHSSSTYGTRWRDSGEVLPPPLLLGQHVTRPARRSTAPSGRSTPVHTARREFCCD